MTFLAGLGGTSFSGPWSLQLFTQQPYADIPYKYVKHLETSNCLKQHMVNGLLCTDLGHLSLSVHTILNHLFSFMIHVLSCAREFPSAIGHPLEIPALQQDVQLIQFVHLVLPKSTPIPELTRVARGGSWR